MIDPNILAEQPELVKEHLRRRYADADALASVDRIVELTVQRKTLIGERDGLRGERNRLSKQIGLLYREGRGDEAEEMKAAVEAGADRTRAIEAELEEVEAKKLNLAMRIPNLLHDTVGEGRTEDDNPLIRTWGEPRPDTTPAHVEIGEALGIIDLERSTKLAGARFSILFGAAARLERSLINWFLDLHTGEHGHVETMVPYIVHRQALEGTGQLPKFEVDMFRLEGLLNGSDAFLIPTAEVPVTNIHRGEILDEADLPKKFVCFTPCFRSEAGSAGRDVRGLIRQHQFHKVEMVWITRPQDGEEAHLQLLGHAETCLQRLDLPYRVVMHCGGETSFSAHRCFDLEVWLPSQGRYREISSVSHFSDFQARRMGLRYRPLPLAGQKKAKPQLVHTLNGSGLAVGRTVAAILENRQQADGTILIPEVLQPYMGSMKKIEP